MTLRTRLPIAVTVIAVVVALVLFTDSAFSQTGGTGGTGPVEPTPTAAPTVTPTPTPVPPEIKTLIALGQITVKLAAIQDRLAAIELGIAVLSFTPTPGPSPLPGQTVIEICNQCEIGVP